MAALEALQSAKKELEAGEHNKGGHGVKALELVHKAIEQTRKGIEAGEKENSHRDYENSVWGRH